jgi:uncharacterized protein (TIRG00374 family)
VSTARVVPVAVALAAVGALLLVVDPRLVATAVQRFDSRVVVPILLLVVAFYLLQGLRWHLLLRAIGASRSVADSQLINLAGQTVTAVLPLGDLTRALLASEASGVEFGATAATVTVQELTFTLLLVLAAVPGLAHLPNGVAWALAVVGGIAAVVAILTVPRAYAVVRRLVAVTPGLRRFLAEIDALQRSVRDLLVRPGVLAGTVLDLGRVVAATAALVLILRGLHVEFLTWWDVALVVAVSYVGGALSLLPGGIGANEAGVVGILVILGVNPAAAAAAAILQRLTLSGVATVGGFGAFLAVRRRLQLTGIGGLRQLVGSAQRAAQPALRDAPAEQHAAA